MRRKFGFESRGKQAPIEWVGGIAPMPAYIDGEGEPYRPQGLIWITGEGIVAGAEVLDRDRDPCAAAADSLRTAIDQPMVPDLASPSKIRVASPELAQALQKSFPDLEVVCAPTPEFDEVMEAMSSNFGEGDFGYLNPSVNPEMLTSFFSALATLYRVEPWSLVPDDQSLISVTIEQLELRDCVLSVIGQLGESFGFVMFDSIDDFARYLDAASVFEVGGRADLPAHIGLNFERGADMPPVARREISQHGWEVVSPDAYPHLYVVDTDLTSIPPGPRDYARVEAIARALSQFLLDENAMSEAWSPGDPVVRTYVVPVAEQSVEITLAASAETGIPFAHGEYDLWIELKALGGSEELVEDFAIREALETELLDRFVRSPEFEPGIDAFACEVLMDFAANYYGETIATLTPDLLQDILFDIFPRKVSVGPDEAQAIIDSLRAFYRFLKREFDFERADACLRVLSEKTARELEYRLGDSSNFGMAKSLVMSGRDAGFDVDTEEGLGSWAGLQTAMNFLEPPKTSSSGDVKARKSRDAAKRKRKLSRKSRRKNR